MAGERRVACAGAQAPAGFLRDVQVALIYGRPLCYGQPGQDVEDLCIPNWVLLLPALCMSPAADSVCCMR